MNAKISQSIASSWRTPASFLRACVFFCCFALCASLAGNAQNVNIDPGLTAHEWGTFTTIAGEAGQAVEWLPLNGRSDLPSFVEHFRGTGFKVGLGGTIRMETPVLYFYSTHDTKVDVGVSFSHGLITEWYPHARKVEPAETSNDALLYQRQSNGTISWKSVIVQPAADRHFPSEAQPSHYYAARATAASPLSVFAKNGVQHEQFLFYRGVSVAPAPISALVLPSGQIEAMNQSADTIPKIILFERRGDKVGYREFNSLRAGVILDPPTLNGSLDSLLPELEAALGAAGLYQDEAHAMLESWKDSWFEEGSRLIYIVPRSFVDKILPLSIEPEPANIQRVFVGRMELLTPATQRAIETAAAAHDRATLAKYGRFLAPMIETILRKNPDAADKADLGHALNEIYNSNLLAQNAGR